MRTLRTSMIIPKTFARTVTASFVALTLVSGLAACGGESDSAAPETGAPASGAAAALVLSAGDVATATTAEMASSVLLTGMLEPATRVTVTAQVPGTVSSISADRGSVVTKDSVLATIDAEGVRAALVAAEANLAAAATRYTAAQRLFAAGATSRADLEGAEASYKAAEAQVAGAKEQASFTRVRAPFAGSVSARMTEAGTYVRGGDALFTVVQTSVLEVAGRVPVDQATAVRVGQTVTFTIDAIPGREFRGTVDRRDPTADPASRQVGVYVRIPNANGEIVAGQYARGEVRGPVTRMVQVPLSAVQGSGDATFVYVIANGTLVRRAVTLGARDARRGTVGVSAGVTAGEQVLVRPTGAASDGQLVTVQGAR